MNTFELLVLSICVISVDCSHFRGASFSWAPLSNGSIQVDYRISWRRSFGSHSCDDNTIASRLLSSEGSLCPSYDPINCHPLNYYCTDYSEEDDWTSGKYTLLIDPIGENFTLTFSGGAWVGFGSWSLLSFIDLTPRDTSGWINSSPTVDYPPLVNLLHGCNHTISFPIRDVDGDIVRCRWASGSTECGSVCREQNNLLPAAQLNQSDCTITYEATDNIGLYPLAVQVEDFANSSSSVPLSSIPLQFIVNIYNITSSSSCATELRFVTPTPASGDCFVLNVGEDFTVNITVTGTSSLNSLVTTSALGMQRSAVISWQKGVSYYMSVTVHWTPTTIDDEQDHGLCFYARDINGRYSETICITLSVGVSPPIPTRVERISTTNAWNIEFNRQFSLPANYVNLTVVKTQTGEPAFYLNTSNTTYVSFYPTDKRIQVILDFDFEPPQYHVIIPEGIVRREGNCAILSPEVTSSSFWTFEIDCYLGFFRTINDNCLECEEFQYGFNCSSDCTCERTNSVSCNKINGTCECHKGWTGDNCTVNVDECEISDICSNKSNSYCVDVMGTYDCQCHVGYVTVGDECFECQEFQYGFECSSGCTCDRTNSASCNKINGSCECFWGWTGDNCSANIDECEISDICSNKSNSYCVDVMGTYDCQCYVGYVSVGDECFECEEFQYGFNCSSDCTCDRTNSVSCNKINGTCECHKGWTGDNCTVNIDECEISDICSNKSNSYCVDVMGTYDCQCNVGYDSVGDECFECEEFQYGFECSSDCTCDRTNSVSCDKINGTCECHKGWTGENCTVNIDECEISDICSNKSNSYCVDVMGTYDCQCNVGYGSVVDECFECEEFQYGLNCSSDCTCDRTNSVSCDKINGTCECHKGWTGDNCTANIDECEISDICSNKSNSYCLDVMGTYDCHCHVGYVTVGDECFVNYGLMIYLSAFLSLAIILVVLLVLCCLLLRKQMTRKKLLKKEIMTKQKLTLPGVPENVSRLIYDGRKWKAVTDLDDVQTTTTFVDNKHSGYSVDNKTHKTSKSKLQQRYDVLATNKFQIPRPMVKDDDQRRDYMEPGDGYNHRGHREQRHGGFRRSYSDPTHAEHIRVHIEQGQHDYRR